MEETFSVEETACAKALWQEKIKWHHETEKANMTRGEWTRGRNVKSRDRSRFLILLFGHVTRYLVFILRTTGIH